MVVKEIDSQVLILYADRRPGLGLPDFFVSTMCVRLKH